MTTTVLLTRPEAQSRRFAAALVERFGADVAPVIAPLQRIVARAPLPPAAPDAEFIFTSENGVAVFGALGGVAAGRVAWCVGARTGDAAGAAGFAVRTGPGDAQGLAAAIADAGGAAPLVHLHGVQVSGDIAGTLRSAGREVTAHAIYEQVAEPMPANGRAALAAAGPLILPVFSVRSAQLLAPWLERAEAPLAVAAISRAVANALPEGFAATASISQSPDSAGICAEIAALLGRGSFLEGSTSGR